MFTPLARFGGVRTLLDKALTSITLQIPQSNDAEITHLQPTSVVLDVPDRTL